jgi:predicted homoserine dehydrogenase-like protein
MNTLKAILKHLPNSETVRKQQSMELLRKLEARLAAGNPIKAGIIGCGQMGSGLAHTINNIRGMQVHAIADIEPERARKTLIDIGIPAANIRITEKQGEANDLLNQGKFIVTPDALLMTRLDLIDANVEATGVTDVGARVAFDSIERKKPIIMLNVETDVTIGAYLNQLARKNNALYTVASGDEPGVCKMLYEQAVLAGFEIISIGKGKNNPIDFDATPESCQEEAASKDMNPKILASFLDGTKTMVEMAAVSNSTGLVADTPGMHGPKVEIDELLQYYIPEADGGILSQAGCVDYSTGAIAPGVFVIVRSYDERIRKDMHFITKAKGPYYLLFRPYHLCDLETPQSIAEAVLLNEVTVAAETMHSEVATIAKRNIRKGEVIKGIGSADIFGRIYTYADAYASKSIPLGIAENGIAKSDIRKGELITQHNLTPDSSTFIYGLRKEQDKFLNYG